MIEEKEKYAKEYEQHVSKLHNRIRFLQIQEQKANKKIHDHEQRIKEAKTFREARKAMEDEILVNQVTDM